MDIFYQEDRIPLWCAYPK